jgi:prevent-host-death family protein
MSSWALQAAKAKLGELVDKAKRDGPQTIARRGVDQVAVVPIEQWKRMGGMAKPTLLEVLQSGPQFDLDLPVRGRMLLRKSIPVL